MAEEQSNWATPSLMESPFWRDGMTPEEYDKENEYLDTHYDMILNGTYMPLWKQKNKGK